MFMFILSSSLFKQFTELESTVWTCNGHDTFDKLMASLKSSKTT